MKKMVLVLLLMFFSISVPCQETDIEFPILINMDIDKFINLKKDNKHQEFILIKCKGKPEENKDIIVEKAYEDYDVIRTNFTEYSNVEIEKSSIARLLSKETSEAEIVLPKDPMLLPDPVLMDTSKIIYYQVNPKEQELKFYWKDTNGNNYANFENLKVAVEKKNKELIFAMNGGMYLKDQSAQGLFIENGSIHKKIDQSNEGYGNFYLQPNGIFYVTKKKEAFICTTKDFKNHKEVLYATQSGPMLLIDGAMHPKFTKGSSNVHFRNGVGVLPNGDLLFAISKEEINFYDFASFFKKSGCKNALYLDGFVSRAYIPSKNWKQLDGNFGVIIGVTCDQ